MTDDFFSKAPSTFADYNITTDQLNTLKLCIDGTTTPTEAAKQLAAHPEASPTPLEMQQRLGGLWTLLNDTAVYLPSSQSAIIPILQTIRTFPQVEEPKGEGEEFVDLDDGFFWRELTDWASNWADAFNHHGSNFFLESSKSPEQREARRAAWISANAYTARLAATDDAALSSYGAGLDRASNAIVDALEFGHENEHGNVNLEPAAQLFIYASAELYRCCKGNSTERRLRSGRGKGSATKAFWHGGEDGYSEARWAFWRERWTALIGVQGLSGQARGAAKEALDAMKKVEA